MVWKTLVAQQRINAQLNSHMAPAGNRTGGHLGERRVLYAQANHAGQNCLPAKRNQWYKRQKWLMACFDLAESFSKLSDNTAHINEAVMGEINLKREKLRKHTKKGSP